MYSVSYNMYAFQFCELVCKSISIRLVLFNDFMKKEGK